MFVKSLGFARATTRAPRTINSKQAFDDGVKLFLPPTRDSLSISRHTLEFVQRRPVTPG